MKAKANAFTVINATPVIASVTPATGFNSSIIPVTIAGSAFRNGVIVSLTNGSTTLPGTITNRTSTRILCTFLLTGARAGLYNLSILNIDGTSVTKMNAFTIQATGNGPVIVSFTPVSGVNTATLPLTVNGSNFRAGATVTITNNTTTKTVAATSVTNTQIKCSLPLTGLPFGLYNLTVRNTDGSFFTMPDTFTITNSVPAITTVAPVSGYIDSQVQVTISGSKFLNGLQVILINGSTTIPGTVSAFTVTKFTGTFPLTGSSAGIYNLTVTNPGGPSATKQNCFTITAPGTAPTITNVTPASGVNTAALAITIIGSNIRAGATVIITNGTTTKTVAGTLTGSTQIKCTLPLTGLTIGLYNLTVRNTDGSNLTLADLFTVTNPVPTITTVAPVSGYSTGSVPIAISGSKFVNGVQATLVNQSTTISGTVSAFTATKFTGTFPLTGAPAGIYNLTVTNPGGPSATKQNCFIITAPGISPTITNVTPASGGEHGSPSGHDHWIKLQGWCYGNNYERYNYKDSCRHADRFYPDQMHTSADRASDRSV